MHRAPRPVAILLCALGLLPWALQGVQPAGTATFAAEIERLSEPEGAFDTDNLISNERSYLDVVPALISGSVTGGVYIGVGPDQNFSYIARIRPSIAYIIDVRRDNLLLHLLFKALFAQAATRIEYLSLLTGRPVPLRPAGWNKAGIQQLVEYIDTAKAAAVSDQLQERLDRTIERYGVPLTREDYGTIARFHGEFVRAGLSLQFRSHGRPPQYHYPTLRELLLATDADGRSWNYLASEEDFQFVRSLEARDAIVPVVGNVSGPRALRAIGATIAARGERVSAFYISNVESYLFRDGGFLRFADNLRRLPHNGRTVMIRSIFGGSSSISEVQPMDEVIARAAGR